MKCDTCGNQFDAKDKQIKQGIQKRVLICTHCKQEHLINIMDKKSRRLMIENKEDKKTLGNINRRSSNLKKQNRFTQGQAKQALNQSNVIKERINKRTEQLDKHSRKLIDEYKEKV